MHRAAWRHFEAVDGTEIDDMPALLTHEYRQNSRDCPQRPFNIQVDSGLPFHRVDLDQRADKHDPGAVDQRIQRTKILSDLRDCCPYLLFLCHIDGIDAAFATRVAYRPCNILGLRFVDVGDRDLRPFVRDPLPLLIRCRRRHQE
ncbi:MULTISPECIES: hypothetical protein [Bradyrhizobium]|jgi:hypothetical protein|uniref:hypothetical protein n=1 Tax=Bradyrhizobium sp. Mp27 TaxID=3042157 RepID=UPI0004840E09|nr:MULTISPECIES: hypothetical protein [Bradyrhizobium]MDI2077173.1 hypothetical protein [Bradyrhizobium sp. Mp27]